jgi:hypothetical protein
MPMMSVRLRDWVLRAMLPRLVVLRTARCSMSARCEVPRAVFQILELMEDFGTVEGSDVFGLDWREPTNRPAQMHEVRFDGVRERMHSNLFGELVPFPSVAGAARRHDVAPVVRTTTGERNEVIASERFTRPQLDRRAATVLAAISVASEEKGVGDLAAETTGHVNEPRQSNDRRARHSQPFRANDASLIRFHNLGLAVDDEPESAFDRHHRQRLERGVQCETPQYHASLLLSPN